MSFSVVVPGTYLQGLAMLGLGAVRAVAPVAGSG